MAILRSIPRSRKMPSLRNVVMVDTVRGVLRVRKWPKKYGKARSALQQYWIDWFTQANRLAKYADGMAQARAIEMTKGSGLYPRDVMVSAMRGRLYSWVDQNGWKWYPVAAIQDISNSLDVLAQSVGSVLVRAADRWRAPPDGSFDDVLTCKGVGNPIVWQAPPGGGGVTQQVLPGTPIVPDGTLSQYDLDVSDYANLTVQFDGLGFASSDRPIIRLSIDGAVTFKAAAGDYSAGYVNAGADAWGTSTAIYGSTANSTANQNGVYQLTNLRAGRAQWSLGASNSAGTMSFRTGFLNYDGPVTDIRIESAGAANFNAGTIRVVGLK